MFSTTFHGVQEGDVVEARKIEAQPAGPEPSVAMDLAEHLQFLDRRVSHLEEVTAQKEARQCGNTKMFLLHYILLYYMIVSHVTGYDIGSILHLIDYYRVLYSDDIES